MNNKKNNWLNHFIKEMINLNKYNIKIKKKKKNKKIEINKNNLLNWSILINRGKENNDDFHSNGEWNGIYKARFLINLL